MKQNLIPFTALELGTRDTARQNSQASEQVMTIDLSKIVVRENFNIRTELGNLDELKNSLLQNGQNQPALVDILANGTFALVDGHRRYYALLKAWNETGTEPKLKAIVNTKKVTEEDRIFQMFTSQDNKQLEAFEVAELINRLLNLGYKATAIATKLGKTESYVSMMLSYTRLPQQIKNEVVNKSMSIGTALHITKNSATTTDAINTVNLAKLQNENKTRITIKDTKVSKNELYALIVEEICTLYELENQNEPIFLILKKHLN